jgi:hypothetical protein
VPDRVLWYIYLVIAAGSAALAVSLADGLHIASPFVFGTYLGLAIVASLFKMRLPGIEGTYSLNTLFILFGLYYLSPGETTVTGCVAVTVQSLWAARHRPSMLQVVFNIANVTLSIGAAFAATSIALVDGAEAYRPALMAAAAFVQFAVNTLIVSGVLSLLQGERLDEIWGQWFEWSFPYYVIGAAIVALLPFRGRMAQPEAWIILLPLLYLVHFFYGLSIGAKNPEATADASPSGQLVPRSAAIYMRIALCVGALILARALAALDTLDPARFVAFLTLGVVTSAWKIRLPGMPATISLGFVVTLFSIAEMPFSQAIVISAVTCLVQVLWKAQRRPAPLQTAFSMASLAISTALAHWVVNSMASVQGTSSITATLAVSTAVLFCVNTLLISAAICLLSGKPLKGIWQGCYFWSFPCYLAGAGAAGLMVMTARSAGWVASVIILPVMGMVYVSYRRHVGNAVARGVTEPGITEKRVAPEILAANPATRLVV